jgi:branched-chain amino acid transport system substrate-binding protein
MGLILCLLGAGCSSKEPVRIGFVGGTSGRVADLGISGRDAVQLAVEACNRDGGIDGRPVQLLIRNDAQDPDLARRAVSDLISQGVVAFVGPMTSDMAMAVLPLLNDARVLTVSPTATTQKLSGMDDYFLRVSSTTREYAGKSARYHVRTGTMRRIAATYDLANRSFCENWLENFAAVFTGNGGEIVTTIGFATDQGRSFLNVVRDLLAAKPDGILIVANSMDAALLCQQIRKFDATLPITLADWGATERLFELGGKAVEGITVVQTFDRDSPAPRYRDFRKAYLSRYQREPGFPGVYSYDAIQVVLTALRHQQESQHLKEAILAISTFEGLQGSFSFDEFGDVKRSNASISVVRNRKFVVVE